MLVAVKDQIKKLLTPTWLFRPPSLLKKNILMKNRIWLLCLMIISALVFAFLWRNRGFVPMWVEGIGELVGNYLVVLGFSKETPPCWLHLGVIHLPLALAPYIGATYVYIYAPSVYLWFSALVADPYVYRGTGFILFIADAWLLFYLLRQFFKTSICFYTTVTFLTLPNYLIFSLSEYQTGFIPLSVLLLAILFFVTYVRGGGNKYLLISSMFAGMTLTTRAETFVWPIASLIVYMTVARPSLIVQKWKALNNKAVLMLLVTGGALLGAAPFIAYNFVCPQNNILIFVRDRVLARSLDTRSETFTDKLITRLDQFWYHVLLNIGPAWEMPSPNYVFAILWLLCAGLLIIRWLAQGNPSLSLIVILTSIPLSLLTSGGNLRYEHLTILTPVALLTITSGLAYLEKFPPFSRLIHVIFVSLILGGITASVLDWRHWNRQPDTAQTMLNQADPVLLTGYLLQHHANDRIIYTNIGMLLYAQYITAGRLLSEDIMDWNGTEGFINAAKGVLLSKSRRRVFVAVAQERDGAIGTVPRTKALYSLLSQYNVPHTVTHLSNKRNRFLYDIIIIDKGVTLQGDPTKDKKLPISEVTDVRIVTQLEGEKLIIGSIRGTELQLGDMIIVDGEHTFPTTFGNGTWITFAIPSEAVENQQSFLLEVVRPSTLERSQPFTVNIRR